MPNVPHVIRLRDVARNATYERGPDEPVLLVPYELFQPVGAVRRRGSLVDWLEGAVIRSGRAVAALLRDTSPGERVLLQLDKQLDEWWLCEIDAVVGGETGVSARDAKRESATRKDAR
jgi:hypothetical protein